MKEMTFAEEQIHVTEIALEHFRDLFLLGMQVTTDGLPALYSKQERQIIKFFSESTTAETWEALRQLPDPEQPTQSLGETWLQQWEQAVARRGGVRSPSH